MPYKANALCKKHNNAIASAELQVQNDEVSSSLCKKHNNAIASAELQVQNDEVSSSPPFDFAAATADA